jgi:hypothetical protein
MIGNGGHPSYAAHLVQQLSVSADWNRKKVAIVKKPKVPIGKFMRT